MYVLNKLEEDVAWIKELLHENRCGTIPDVADDGESHTMPKLSDMMNIQINCLKINASFTDWPARAEVCQKV
jgi:hypothetical protein